MLLFVSHWHWCFWLHINTEGLTGLSDDNAILNALCAQSPLRTVQDLLGNATCVKRLSLQPVGAVLLQRINFRSSIGPKPKKPDSSSPALAESLLWQVGG